MSEHRRSFLPSPCLLVPLVVAFGCDPSPPDEGFDDDAWSGTGSGSGGPADGAGGPSAETGADAPDGPPSADAGGEAGDTASAEGTESGAPADPSAGDEGSDEGGSSGGDEDPPPVACDGGGLEPGSHDDLTLEHDGIQRSYDVYIPAGYDPMVGAPLVFDFHGLGSNSTQQANNSGLDEFADAEGFIVVRPNGVDSAWNGGNCCGDSDDLGFVLALVEQMQIDACVDPARIYATGMSNGGIMSHRLACDAADTFAAVAPVAGMLTMSPASCTPARPIPVLAFHGTADNIVSYSAAQSAIETWVELNGCSGVPTVSAMNGDVICETWDECDEGVTVTLCSVDGGGHCWPGKNFCAFGSGTDDMNASAEMAAFFAAWSL